MFFWREKKKRQKERNLKYLPFTHDDLERIRSVSFIKSHFIQLMFCSNPDILHSIITISVDYQGADQILKKNVKK